MHADAATSERTMHPLALFYWGAAWTLAVWCELRDDFRNFRLDRIAKLKILDEMYSEEPGRSLADFYRYMAENDMPAGDKQPR